MGNGREVVNFGFWDGFQGEWGGVSVYVYSEKGRIGGLPIHSSIMKEISIELLYA